MMCLVVVSFCFYFINNTTCIHFNEYPFLFVVALKHLKIISKDADKVCSFLELKTNFEESNGSELWMDKSFKDFLTSLRTKLDCLEFNSFNVMK